MFRLPVRSSRTGSHGSCAARKAGSPVFVMRQRAEVISAANGPPGAASTTRNGIGSEGVGMRQNQPHVAVIGGGIGGLFAANALVSQGVSVAVYEQAPALGEIGAGVYITPNSVRHLQRVGLGDAVAKWGALVGPNSHYFRHDGSPIAPVRLRRYGIASGQKV